jgi:SRSO17 transposase
LLDRELYLPKSWAQDPARCREADVPAEVGFATKPELAARMLWRSLDAGVPAAWVTGDTVYGSHRPLRAGLEARKQAYALAVTCQEYVEIAGKQQRVDQLAREVAPQAWQRLSAGAGSQGPRLYDWVRLRLSSPVPPAGSAGWSSDAASLREPKQLSGPTCWCLPARGRPCRRWSR